MQKLYQIGKYVGFFNTDIEKKSPEELEELEKGLDVIWEYAKQRIKLAKQRKSNKISDE